MQLTAPAKLTLSLRITGRRDDGMHLIDAEMVTLDLADLVWVDDTAMATIVSYAGEYPVSIPFEDDLVAKAMELVGGHASITVHKHIPPRAGLGGGSADAAAILRWAEFGDLDQAAAIGADVAFCTVGGRARVGGIGEVVEPLPFSEHRFTLLIPDYGCSTAEVYAKWDELGGPEGENGNDLEPAALAVEPRLVDDRDRLGNITGQRPRLAGSGSTWFVEGAFPGGGRIVAQTVPA
ncbi:MAG: 4-(cytidine 5'-diphospho)-2-C-methyl-D-erythritol kinase [Acidimicrobiales bacterium]